MNAITLLSYFNLLSQKEADEVKKNNLVIQAIEEKERLYYMTGSYIDHEDRVFMNVNKKKFFCEIP